MHGRSVITALRKRDAASGAPGRLFVAVLLTLSPAVALADPSPAKLQFNRDIRPILSDKCFRCHGPDSASRKGELRLDVRDQAIAARDQRPAIAPGDAAGSELVRRVTSDSADERMPPASSGSELSPREIELLKQWIDAGAEYQPHWSFIAPTRPAIPATAAGVEPPANPIDAFVRARLAAEGLEPSPEADKTTLLRRVTLDLTGLPPTLAEIDAFVADEEPEAYERVVDRLLDSPRYGERMATAWLDAARYADTNGYQSDEARSMWRWRDWVIEAFQRNLPFDQFTIEQLAGDLLPHARIDQLIATGFNRNHRANSEGGIIPEEYLVEYAVDRLDTTATVWLGLTIGCARCHDHKYDPVSQKDFYRLLAFFNNIPEQGKVTRTGTPAPMIKAPTPEIEAEGRRLDAELAAADKAWRELKPRLTEAQADWERSFAAAAQEDPIEGLAAHFELDGHARDSQGKLAEGKFVGGDPAFATGKIGEALDLRGNRYVEAADPTPLDELGPISYGAWIYPKTRGPMAVLSRMDEQTDFIGYDLFLDGGKVQADLVARLLDDSIRVETSKPIALDAWRHVLVTYDGSRSAKGVRIYVDGVSQPLAVIADTLSLAVKTDEPLRIGARGTGAKFRGLVDDVRIYGRELTADEALRLASSESIGQLLAISPEARTAAQAQQAESYFLRRHAPDDLREAFGRVERLRDARATFEKNIPTTMVMQEKPTPGGAFVLMRGQYDKPGERVEPGVPASLPKLPAGVKPDRLALARWLVDPANPLPARVTANRFWQLYFGAGLVKTTEDFGSQGERPVHAELLDWLATEFVATGWDVKRLQKLIVTSATYRQSSRVGPELLARDPENRLLARGPRFRLSAEMVRDSALAIGGLLVEQVGGPSVKPYQPPGLWEELGASAGKYTQDRGASLYRRSMYTFWKRTIPPPAMMVFDAAGREMCCVRQSRTNTPLQALALLNDIPYVEASRALAERVLAADAATDDQRLEMAFRLATGRRPKLAELAILRAGHERHLAQYRSDPESAARLLAVGERKRGGGFDPPRLAAMTVMASTILNLDETITKE